MVKGLLVVVSDSLIRSRLRRFPDRMGCSGELPVKKHADGKVCVCV